MLITTILAVALGADPAPLPAYPVEELPNDSKAAKIVLIAGSSVYKPGEHAYVANCLALMDLLKQTSNVAPVLAIDWPKKAETLPNAKAIVCLFDGGDKHAFLKDNRFAEMERVVGNGTGIVQLHQCLDVPADVGERQRVMMGAAWEKGVSQRAHWVAKFDSFFDHPITQGVKPFQVDDGWLTHLRFVPVRKGVTPLLRTYDPKKPAPDAPQDTVVAWAFFRPGGRSFGFTGGHLHSSLADENYRRFLVNAILWTAGLEIPPGGAPVALDPEKLPRYLVTPPAPPVPPAKPAAKGKAG